MSASQPTSLPRTNSLTAPLTLSFIPVGIAVNLTIGTLAHAMKLPLYLDAIGTIVSALLLGWRAGVIVGVGSFLLGGVLTNPVLPWFSGTQAAIAIYVHVVAQHGGFKSYRRVIAAGLGLGIVAGVVSAPVIAVLFGGVTGSGASVIVAFLLSSGHSLLKSVFLSGLACEPIDKLVQSLMAFWLIRGLPPRLLKSFKNRSI